MKEMEKMILAALFFSQALTFCLGGEKFFKKFISFYKSYKVTIRVQ